ncbi:MAG: hypothetical protein PWQ51_1708 [Methanolobus sp.]|nr:hypothetical protein [Methanolobus sp.]
MIGIATIGFSFVSDDMNHSVSKLGQNEEIKISATIPNTTTQIPYYKVLSESREKKSSSNLMDTKESILSEKEAVESANEFIQKNGGLPEDAYLYNVQSLYAKQINTSTGQKIVEAEYPIMTEVTYKRKINGFPVVGPGDTITISYGENEEMLYYSKGWRILEEEGTKEIMDAEKAIEKLKKGDTITKTVGGNIPIVEIVDMEIGYFAPDPDSEVEYYEPIWIFKGKDNKGNNVTRYIEGL